MYHVLVMYFNVVQLFFKFISLIYILLYLFNSYGPLSEIKKIIIIIKLIFLNYFIIFFESIIFH